ncbi:hypothetical protein M408DRAFT_332191 [Serendipita vermifera MAFF 305830]|uniref:Nitrogen regulatory protein areA GATA-like domain-containing protein n=1 Tax=Serendipita vermifera MAFF 305830 TaxID=933852 RepID=A0A0C3AGD5_SERVB|nr:hypothetical protein M408DRAFT_332191 [Serendipita vermifera MAFF 305830]
MSLNFKNTLVIPGSSSRHSQDDLYLRGPVLLAKTQVNPLTAKLASDFIAKTWRLATVGKDDLVQGARFENALWRLWRQEMLGLKKTTTSGIDRDQLERASIALFIPVVVSHETCHARNELLLVSSVQNGMINHVEDPQWPPGHSYDSDECGSSFSIRTCLKRFSMTERSDSPISFKSMVSKSSEEHPRRHVMFNSCVVQGLIVDISLTRTADEDDEVSSISDSEPADDLPNSRLEDLDETDEESESSPTLTIPRCKTLKQDDFLAIRVLPPVELFPPPGQDERDTKIVFVPPVGMEDLEEEALCRLEKFRPVLKRTVSSRDLTQELQDLEFENALEEVGLASRSNTNRRLHDDNEEEELVICKRRRRSKSFSIGAEESPEPKGDLDHAEKTEVHSVPLLSHSPPSGSTSPEVPESSSGRMEPVDETLHGPKHVSPIEEEGQVNTGKALVRRRKDNSEGGIRNRFIGGFYSLAANATRQAFMIVKSLFSTQGFSER